LAQRETFFVTIDPVVVFQAASGGFLVLALLFFVLWLLAARGRRKQWQLRLEVEREQLDLRLSLDEQTARLRIVRELHEVVVHSVSVMVSQADGARYASEQDPAAAVRAIVTIGDSARSTLADLRRIMTLVREGEADVAAQPRLKSARELFRIMREAGLVIEFEESGSRFELQHGAEVAIFRILQEALSNALKFGGDGTQVRVTFTWTTEGFQVKVDDDGVRAQHRRSGRDPNEVAQQRSYSIEDDLSALTEVTTGAGITEMRERAALFGGMLHAYSVPGVGFSLSAVFPALKYHNGVHGVNLDD
jgi:signal transduction histidine kinase